MGGSQPPVALASGDPSAGTCTCVTDTHAHTNILKKKLEKTREITSTILSGERKHGYLFLDSRSVFLVHTVSPVCTWDCLNECMASDKVHAISECE